jgi:hypothetical protein
LQHRNQPSGFLLNRTEVQMNSSANGKENCRHTVR